MDPSLQYGKRLIPQILDSLASSDPDRIIYSLAKSVDISHGFRHVTAREFTKAVDKTAWWLYEQVGNVSSIQPVGYIGPHDLRHILLIYACVKVGCTALLLSPKNSTEGALAVLEAANCNIWIKPREEPCLSLVEHVLQKRPMKLLDLPELEELLDTESSDSYPYTKTFEEAIQDPFCLLHTSGSTGLPKPISWSHGLLGTMDAVRLLPSTEGDHGLVPWTSMWNEGDRIYSSFPMSHGAGIIMNLLMPAYFRLHCVLGPAGVIPNMNLMESLADHANIDIWSMVPSLVDELGETLDILEKFKPSKFICASGGPVSPLIGSKVNETIRVLNLTGTTEGLFIGNLIVEREDWLYFAFHPFSGFEFKEVERGIFEHWVHRNDKELLFQGIFYTFPDQKMVNLKDLYTKHPTKPGLWAYKGRNDDVVVLSNGYKISPLDTEALVTTHPAIDGCLMVGTGKAQAVQRANSLSLHKDQLQKDYIAFAEADKPFIRTDKRTIKRRATLAIYADYIERFYNSRMEEEDVNPSITFDSDSLESIMGVIRQILGSLLPSFKIASPETDVFSLGLDSILVFRAIKSIRSVFKLRDRLSPRDLYANPTLESFTTAVSRLLAESKKDNGAAANGLVDDKLAKLNQLIHKHKTRLSTKVNPFDMTCPNMYGRLNFFIPLRKGVSFRRAFKGLQEGLKRTIELIPVLEGKIIHCSEEETSYKKGEVRIDLPALPSTATPEANCSDSSDGPKQLVYKDLSQILPSYQELHDAGFLASAFADEMLNEGPWIPSLPADVLVSQANFVEGGCILALNVHHACFDGAGIIIALKVWAESCRYVQGDTSKDCSWLDPESSNRSLPYILYEQEGYAKPAHEVDPAVWGFLPFQSPEGLVHKDEGGKSKNLWSSLPAPPAYTRQLSWPPCPTEDGRHLTSTTFLIPSEKLQELKQQVLADPEAKGIVTSESDIVQAFFYRAVLKARYRAATELLGKRFNPNDISILEMAVDVRYYFSSLLPASYMGNMGITNRLSFPIETICSPETSVGRIAYDIRDSVKHITPPLVHDCFTLLQSVSDYSAPRYAGMGIDGMHMLMNNLMMFQTNDISFGSDLFEKDGCPDALRLPMGGFNTALRVLVIYPIREDGGIEMVLGTYPEEFHMLMADKEFMKYARFLG